MAFQTSSSLMSMMPPFRGVTRRLVLASAGMYVLAIVLSLVAAGKFSLALVPLLALGHQPWQFLTYGLLPGSLLSLFFGLYMLWVIGADLESDRGGQWLTEYFFATAIGGGLLTAVLARVQVLGIPANYGVVGLWPVLIALVMAFARRNPEAEMSVFFILRTKAKYLAMVLLFAYVLLALVQHDKLGAVNLVACALCGFLFLRFVPRRGLGFASSEGWYSLRNAYYRAKRRKAAKKFTVYMKKQGKDVSFDESGRYLDPNGTPRDPNDKRWMN